MDESFTKSCVTLELHKVLDRLADCAVCPPTRTQIRELAPCCTLEQIELLQSETAEAIAMLLEHGSPAFYGSNDCTAAFARARLGATLTPAELLEIARTLKTARLLRSYRDADPKTATALDSLFYGLAPNRFLEDAIDNAIISPEEIADRASRELAEIRRKQKAATARIREVLQRLIRTPAYQKYLQEPIITMRGDRYVVPVRQEFRSEVPGLIHDTSTSGATVFVEPVGVVDANNELRLLQNQEEREIERILADFTAQVAASEQLLQADQELIGKLDLVFARAKLSRRMKGSRPQLNDQGEIALYAARHPLLDAATVVPIDVKLGGSFDTLIITGPNTGGKTVALKTIGLLTLMAQCGLQLPAGEGSRMSVFTEVFADIGDEQSIEQSLSTFSAHMKNIVAITAGAGHGSLALLDELGAGTDPVEGAALAVAVLQHLRYRDARIAATTHYSELKTYALTTDGVQNASCEFDVATLRPTYRLLLGVPGKSNAFAISARLGLPEEIIESARRLLDGRSVAFEDVLSELEKARKQTDAEQRAAQELRGELERMKQQTVHLQEEERRRVQRELDGAKREAQLILARAKAAADQVTTEINEIRKQKEQADIAARLEQMRRNVKQSLKTGGDFESPDALRADKTDLHAYNVKPGDEVKLLNLRQSATVLTAPDAEGNLTVQAGAIKIKINCADITSVSPAGKRSAEGKQLSASVGTRDIKAREVRTEADLRGMDVQEALDALEQFLDQAVLCSLPSVTVIHGKGTGTLRSAVQRTLKDHPQVKSYRLGRYGEGENGVTVVELK